MMFGLLARDTWRKQEPLLAQLQKLLFHVHKLYRSNLLLLMQQVGKELHVQSASTTLGVRIRVPADV